MTTHFLLVRHGETQWNADQRLQGWKDIPLNQMGLDQAQRLAQHLRSPAFDVRIDAVVSSDLCRAMDTAKLATAHLGLPILASAPLRERNFGVYEGQDWAKLKGAQNTGGLNFRDPHQAVEGGETLAEFEARVLGAFEDLAERHRSRNVMVFAHGGVIDIVWRKTAGVSLEAPRLDLILNTSINHFSIDAERRWAAVAWGQAGHLEEPALDDIG